MYYHTLKLQCDNSLKFSNIRNNTFDTITVYNTTSLKFFLMSAQSSAAIFRWRPFPEFPLT